MEKEARSSPGSSDDVVGVVAELKAYLIRIIPAVVANEIVDIEVLKSNIGVGDNIDSLAKFSSTSESSVLLIEENVGNSDDGGYTQVVHRPLLDRLTCKTLRTIFPYCSYDTE
jgi:hypothetical protein